MPSQLQHIRELVLPVVSGVEEIKVCILYGSVVKGRLRGDSDVDIAVGGAERMGQGMMMKLRGDLALVCGRPVDLIDIQAVSGVILHQILTTGSRILIRDVDLYAGMIKRMLFNQADMMPYYRRVLSGRREEWLMGARGRG